MSVLLWNRIETKIWAYQDNIYIELKYANIIFLHVWADNKYHCAFYLPCKELSWYSKHLNDAVEGVWEIPKGSINSLREFLNLNIINALFCSCCNIWKRLDDKTGLQRFKGHAMSLCTQVIQQVQLSVHSRVG